MEQIRKPISGWTRSLEKSTDTFEKDEMKDERQKKEQRMDALTEKLKCTYFLHKMRWPWLVFEFGGLRHPLEVDRYYNEIKTAIDFGQVPPAYAKVKELLLKENGITYINLENERDLRTLALGLL